MPGWSPPGKEAPSHKWRYDLRKGFAPPGHSTSKDGTQYEMPDGFDPAHAPRGFHVVASPPGTSAPIDEINYTPDTKEVHGVGTLAPVDKLNYSLVSTSKYARKPQPQSAPASPSVGAGADAAGAMQWPGTPPIASQFPTPPSSVQNSAQAQPQPNSGSSPTSAPPGAPYGRQLFGIGSGADMTPLPPDDTNPVVDTPPPAAETDSPPTSPPAPAAGGDTVAPDFTGRKSIDANHIAEYQNGKLKGVWTLKPGGIKSDPTSWSMETAPATSSSGIQYGVPYVDEDGAVRQKGSNGEVRTISTPRAAPRASTPVETWGDPYQLESGEWVQKSSRGQLRAVPGQSSAASRGPTQYSTHWGTKEEKPDGSVWQQNTDTGEWMVLQAPTKGVGSPITVGTNRLVQYNPETNKYEEVYRAPANMTLQTDSFGSILGIDTQTGDVKTLYEDPAAQRTAALKEEQGQATLESTRASTMQTEMGLIPQPYISGGNLVVPEGAEATAQYYNPTTGTYSSGHYGHKQSVPDLLRSHGLNLPRGVTDPTKAPVQPVTSQVSKPVDADSSQADQTQGDQTQSYDTSGLLPAGEAGMPGDPVVGPTYTPPPDTGPSLDWLMSSAASPIANTGNTPSAPQPDFGMQSIDDPSRGSPDMGAGADKKGRKPSGIYSDLQSSLMKDIPGWSRSAKSRWKGLGSKYFGKGLDDFTPFVGVGQDDPLDGPPAESAPWNNPEMRVGTGRDVAAGRRQGVEPGVPFGAYEESETLPTEQDMQSVFSGSTPPGGMKHAPVVPPNITRPGSDAGPEYSWAGPSDRSRVPGQGFSTTGRGDESSPLTSSHPYIPEGDDSQPFYPLRMPSFAPARKPVPVGTGQDQPSTDPTAGVPPMPMNAGAPPTGGSAAPPMGGANPGGASPGGGWGGKQIPPQLLMALLTMLLQGAGGKMGGGSGAPGGAASGKPAPVPPGGGSAQGRPSPGAGPLPGGPPSPMGMGQDEPQPPDGTGWQPPVDPQQVVGIGHKFGQKMNVGEPTHHGTDLQAPKGTPVKAPVDGVVKINHNPQGLGLEAVVVSPDGKEHKLGHLSQVTVKAGQQVKAGQVIGAVGDSGLTTGANLHYAERKGGQPVNPEAKMGAMAEMPPVPGTEMMGSGQDMNVPSWKAQDNTRPWPHSMGAGAEWSPADEQAFSSGNQSSGPGGNRRQAVQDLVNAGMSLDQAAAKADSSGLRGHIAAAPGVFDQGAVDRSQRSFFGADIPASASMAWRQPPKGYQAPDTMLGSPAGLDLSKTLTSGARQFVDKAASGGLPTAQKPIQRPASNIITDNTGYGAGADAQRMGVGAGAATVQSRTQQLIASGMNPTQAQQTAYAESQSPGGIQSAVPQGLNAGAPGADAASNVGIPGIDNPGGGSTDSGGASISIDPANLARLQLDEQQAQWTHQYQSSQITNAQKQEDDRHTEAIQGLQQQAQQEADYKAIQEAVNAENVRHNQTQEQLAQQQQQLDRDLEAAREQSQMALQQQQQQFTAGQTRQSNALGIMNSALNNPWLQGLMKLGINPGGASGGGNPIMDLLNQILGTGDGTGGTSGLSLQNAGVPNAQMPQVPTAQQWASMRPEQKAALRTQVEAMGPGAWQQFQTNFQNQQGNTGLAPDMTQLQSATQNPADQVGTQMTADMFGEGSTSYNQRQQKNWGAAQGTNVMQSLLSGTGYG